jgi:O-antigen/teichoic acid export membrane protein
MDDAVTSPGDRSGADRGHERSGPHRAGDSGLDLILDEVDTVVDPLAESVAFGPAVGIAVTGGPMVTLPPDAPAPGHVRAENTVRAGLRQAGPVAVAGMAVNITAALVVVAVARLLTSPAYGELAQLLGLFLILSMPGSAVLVGVVRRVTGLQTTGQAHLVRGWVARIHRICLAAIVVELVLVLVLQGWIARQLHLPNGEGVVLILMAAGVWILLCVDRGLLQAHRSYGGLATNLVVEGGVRMVLVLALVACGVGVAGYALGVLVSEVVATAHAHWLARRAWADPSSAPVVEDGLVGVAGAAPDVLLARRRLLADVSAAFAGLALLGLLQNVDVILLGRLDHAQVGPYAAISVASKALVWGALALGAYLLPEATIRWNEGGHAIRQLGVTLLFLAVPASVLLAIAVFVPQQFLTVVFSARLSTAAAAFAPLVLAMMCLSFSVLVTNYLFGTGSRWIVLVLAAGSGLAVVLVTAAHGDPEATAWADLVAQGVIALGMAAAFFGIHRRHRGQHWTPRWGWQRIAGRG